MSAPPKVLGVLVLGALAASAGAATYSLWRQDQPIPPQVITAGDLDLELAGAATLTETSPDVATPQRNIDLEAFAAQPGDSLQLVQPLTAILDGENMSGRLTVAWDDVPSNLPTGVTASYELRADGRSVATSALGGSIVLDRLAPGEHRWDLVVDVVLDDGPVGLPDSYGSPSSVELGTLVVELDQIRPEADASNTDGRQGS